MTSWETKKKSISRVAYNTTFKRNKLSKQMTNVSSRKNCNKSGLLTRYSSETCIAERHVEKVEKKHTGEGSVVSELKERILADIRVRLLYKL